MTTPIACTPDEFRLLPARDLPAVIDAEQCAAMLRCSRAHVEELADRGILPGTKIGRSWIFVVQQLLVQLESICEAEQATRVAGASKLASRASQERSTLHIAPVEPARTRGRPRLPTPVTSS